MSAIQNALFLGRSAQSAITSRPMFTVTMPNKGSRFWSVSLTYNLIVCFFSLSCISCNRVIIVVVDTLCFESKIIRKGHQVDSIGVLACFLLQDFDVLFQYWSKLNVPQMKLVTLPIFSSQNGRMVLKTAKCPCFYSYLLQRWRNKRIFHTNDFYFGND